MNRHWRRGTVEGAKTTADTARLIQDGHPALHGDGLHLAGAYDGALVAQNALGGETGGQSENRRANGWNALLRAKGESATGAGAGAGHVRAPATGRLLQIQNGRVLPWPRCRSEMFDDVERAGIGASVAALARRCEVRFRDRQRGPQRKWRRRGFIRCLWFPQTFGDIAHPQPEELPP